MLSEANRIHQGPTEAMNRADVGPTKGDFAAPVASVTKWPWMYRPLSEMTRCIRREGSRAAHGNLFLLFSKHGYILVMAPGFYPFSDYSKK